MGQPAHPLHLPTQPPPPHPEPGLPPPLPGHSSRQTPSPDCGEHGDQGQAGRSPLQKPEPRCSEAGSPPTPERGGSPPIPDLEAERDIKQTPEKVALLHSKRSRCQADAQSGLEALPTHGLLENDPAVWKTEPRCASESRACHPPWGKAPPRIPGLWTHPPASSPSATPAGPPAPSACVCRGLVGGCRARSLERGFQVRGQREPRLSQGKPGGSRGCAWPQTHAHTRRRTGTPAACVRACLCVCAYIVQIHVYTHTCPAPEPRPPRQAALALAPGGPGPTSPRVLVYSTSSLGASSVPGLLVSGRPCRGAWGHMTRLAGSPPLPPRSEPRPSCLHCGTASRMGLAPSLGSPRHAASTLPPGTSATDPPTSCSSSLALSTMPLAPVGPMAPCPNPVSPLGLSPGGSSVYMFVACPALGWGSREAGSLQGSSKGEPSHR